jgi:hypothetical protein
MGQRHLRIFTPRDSAPATPPATSRISLRELLPLIAAAQRMNLIWLRDFLDDEVVVTNDLYEVVQAFRSCRPTG